MREVRIRQAIITHRQTWRCWPDTDAPFPEAVASGRWTSGYLRGDVRLVIECRYWPAYEAWRGVGKPPEYPDINNLTTAPAEVIDRQISMLRALSKDCDAILWDHARGCHPAVASELPGLFPLRRLDFADDCPGSSDRKTFPVAHGFNVVCPRMWIYDYTTGATTGEEYRKRGVEHVIFLPMLEANGLRLWLAENGHTMDRRQEALRGDLPIDLAWIGSVGPRAWTPHRGRWSDELHARLGEFDATGLRMKLHGDGLRDGPLLPRSDPRGNGYTVGPVYTSARFGTNVPCSSHFNSRLADLAICGVVPIMCDPWGELALHGLHPGEHYVPYDGTISGLLSTLVEWRDRREAHATIARNFSDGFEALVKERFSHAADPYFEVFA